MNGSSPIREPVMTKDGIAKELRRTLSSGVSLTRAARMFEMDPKTARKYRDSDLLPSQMAKPRTHRTRVDPFAEVWHEVELRLQTEPRLKAYTLFQWLCDKYPGEFSQSTRTSSLAREAAARRPRRASWRGHSTVSGHRSRIRAANATRAATSAAGARGPST